MNKDLIANLTELDEIELIYETHKIKNDKMYLNYTIVCDVDNIVSDDSLLICKKIVATMSIIQELFSKRNVIFSYTIKTSKAFEEDIMNNESKVSKMLTNCEIVYSKDNYFKDLIEENKSYSKTKRA